MIIVKECWMRHLELLAFWFLQSLFQHLVFHLGAIRCERAELARCVRLAKAMSNVQGSARVPEMEAGHGEAVHVL